MREPDHLDPAAVGVIVLAAGGSTRMGQPKQLLRFGGESLLRRAVRTALATHDSRTLVVVGSDAPAMQSELRDVPASIILNGDWARGLSSSIRCAIGALGQAARAALFMTCDQPLVTPSLLQEMIDIFRTASAPLVACEYGGTLGVPALFSHRHFRDLLALTGDAGAKALLIRHEGEVHRIPFPEGSYDVDTIQDFRRMSS